MDAADVTAWLARYEKAWRSPGTGPLADLFTQDATYSLEPYAEPVTGRPAIAAMWEAERDGPAEVFGMTSQIVAVDGEVAVVRVEVKYGDPVHQEFRDLWIIRFAADGRCVAFEEWPFSPPAG
jgi:ketosteroid isomerase-like protein